MKTVAEYLGEADYIPSQKSLKSYPEKNKGPKKTDLDKAMLAMSKLEPEHQQALHDFLAQSLAAHKGDGVSADDAKRNRDSLGPGGGTTSSGEVKMKTLKKVVAETFPNYSEEIRDQLVEVMSKTIGVASAREYLQEVFDSDPVFQLMFANDETIDAVTMLSDRIVALEESIAILEDTKRELQEATMLRQIQEEALYDTPRRRRHSSHNIADDLEGVDEDNHYLMEDGGGHHGISKEMAARVSYLERTARDTVSPSQALRETWTITKH